MLFGEEGGGCRWEEIAVDVFMCASVCVVFLFFGSVVLGSDVIKCVRASIECSRVYCIYSHILPHSPHTPHTLPTHYPHTPSTQSSLIDCIRLIG